MQRNTDSIYYNHAGYRDPTAGKAIERLEAKQATRTSKKRKWQKNGTGVCKKVLQQ